MGKLNHDNDFHGQRTSRSLLAITLAASLAALGCTTNRNLGDGTPTRSGPDVRTAPTSGVTSGGERTMPPPMTSSYTRVEALPEVTARVIRRAPDEAAAIMARHQAARGRYLGVVDPGRLSGRGYISESIHTGAFVNPALATNPQVTVNSSISSQPTAGISSGADGTSVDAGGVLVTGTTAPATIRGSTTPTAAATGPTGFAATGTLPTVASSGIPTVTAASAGAGRATTTAPPATVPTATTATPTTAGSALGSVSSPVRILRSTTGAVTVTNVDPSSPRTSGRNQ